jgi:predicted Zn finger-like uncharacterized protein
MDVRCEKCATEYEFDEGKLKPGGVTVKCAECGHMFRVRKRSPTNVGAPAVPPPPTALGAPTGARATPTPSPLKQASGASARVWLVRDEEGKVQTCRELATLQQWVVAGRVTRECEISRTGKSWKKLGSIAELGSFFRIAEEARRRAGAAAARQAAGNGEAAQPPVRPEAVPAPHPVETTDPLPGAVQPPAKRESGPPPATRPRTSRPLAAASGTPSPVDSLGSGPSVRGQSSSDSPLARTTGGWAAAPEPKLRSGPTGESGPTGGFARGLPTTEAAFASSGKASLSKNKGPTVDDIMPKTFEPTDALLDDYDVPAGSRAGKWIVLLSLLVLGGAGAAVYFVVLKGDKSETVAAATMDAGAGGGIVAGADAGAPAPTPAQIDEALAASAADLVADTPLALESAARRLAELKPADNKQAARATALRARVIAAQAQHALDLDPSATAAAKTSGDEAAQLAAEALALDANSLDAKVAMADALRLEQARTRDVEHHLTQVLEGDPRNREGKLSRALLRERDGNVADARRMYTELSNDASDVRAVYRLALLDFADEKLELAKTRADRVLATQPEHAGALALEKRIVEATAVVQTDPMPPEVNGSSGGDSSGGGSSGGGSRGGGSRGASYESLLERADKLAENGKCSQAMEQYRRALDQNPGGVSALVGLGYCHVDAKQFASAHAKFRAALGISPRHHGALIGVAEAYRQQGLTKQALAAYQAYLDLHPTGPKSGMAKRNIEKLGGTVGGGSSGGGGDSPFDDGGGDDDDDGDDSMPPDPAPTPAPPKKTDDVDLDERVDPGVGPGAGE